MEILTANYASGFRREIVDGKEFIAVPMSLVVPGVLNGSQGPLLYPLDELRASVDAWNGTPITVGHPTRNGLLVSPADDDAIGTVENAKVNGKLTAEAWFDVQKTKRVNSRILDRLEEGRPIELSTGLRTENQDKAGTYGGTPYSAVARNYEPDHLAVLLDDVGACSVADGCGILVNQQHDRRQIMFDPNDTLPLPGPVIPENTDDFVFNAAEFILNDGLPTSKTSWHQAFVGETAEHRHTAIVEPHGGNGITSRTSGHVHVVENFIVQTADGHVHSLDEAHLTDTGIEPPASIVNEFQGDTLPIPVLNFGEPEKATASATAADDDLLDIPTLTW